MYSGRTVIVDIDGTIANGDHRVHYIQPKEKGEKKDWGRYFSLLHDDKPHLDIIWMVKTLHAAGCKIVICSGREDRTRDKTVIWLDEVAGLAGIYEKLYMRPLNDYRNDAIIKKELLDQIRADGYDPFLVIDDRDRVVAMWRDEGLRCLQVAYGDF